MTIDMPSGRELFEDGEDFTVGIEEEYGLFDPDTLDLVGAFEDLVRASADDPVLSESIAGELISSEVEIRSGRSETFDEAATRQIDRRVRLAGVASRVGVRLGAIGTHPWAPWQDQSIIPTPHYQRVSDDLRYVAWRNNTFALHVHVGVRGADRAVSVCDRVRDVLPELLAISANSSYLDGRFAGLHSVRSQVFTKSFPRCGIPDPFESWEAFDRYVRFLVEAGSIVEYTQVWWSIRPHVEFGTVEVRICDAQTRGPESIGVAALICAVVAQAARDFDEGRPHTPIPGRLIEENFWRAIRHGLDADLIDLPRPTDRPARAAAERLIEWTGPARAELRLDPYLEPVWRMLDSGNGAQRQWRRHEEGASMRDIVLEVLEDTGSSLAPEEVST